MRFYILILSVTLSLLFNAPAAAQKKIKANVIKAKGTQADGKKQEKQKVTYSDYENLWRQVDSLEEKGLTRSALEISQNIYAMAIRDANAPQQIKSLLVRLALSDIIKEESAKQAIDSLKSEIAASEKPVKNILQVILAGAYRSYLLSQNNNIINRSEILSVQENFETWDVKTFDKQIISLYVSAMSDAELLKKIPVEDYKDIIDYSNQKSLRLTPSLYDLLAQEFLAYVYDNNLYSGKRTLLFSDEKYFLPAEEFMGLKTGTDSSVGNLTLSLLRDLLRFHLKDSSGDALLRVDLTRLDFIYSLSDLKNKDSLYISALIRLKQIHENDSLLQFILTDMAEYYSDHLTIYERGERRLDRNAAKSLLDISALMEEKNYSPVLNAYAAKLRQYVYAKEMSIRVEDVNLPGEPFRMQVNHRHIDTLQVRITDISMISPGTIDSYFYGDSLKALLSRLPVMKEIAFKLPAYENFESHRTEVPIPPLPPGKYMISAIPGSDLFPAEKKGTAIIDITRLCCLIRNVEGGLKVYAIDRKTGKPVEDAEIKVELCDNHMTTQAAFTKNSDSEGTAEFKDLPQDLHFCRVTISKDGDKHIVRDYYNQEPEDHTTARIVIFTDRRIYRPGQEVKYKILAYYGDEIKQDYKVLPGFYLDVRLIARNNQTFQFSEVKTNDFGSASGSFKIPDNAVAGYWEIKAGDGWEGILVEEYKRPGIKLELQQIKSAVYFGDTVKIHGTVKSYTGAEITGAEAGYTIRGSVYNEEDFRYYGESAPGVISGSKAVDEKGEFVILFVPGQNMGKQPGRVVFHYRVSVTVNDPAGETIESSFDFQVSGNPVKVKTSLPEIVLKENSRFRIKAENINGGVEKLPVHISVFRLKNPSPVFRERLWETPNRFYLDEKEFRKIFPNDPYRDEDDFRNWEKETRVYDGYVEAGDSSFLSFPEISRWKAGKYLLISQIQDRYGNKQEENNYFEVADNGSGQYYLNNALTAFPLTNTIEPGGKLRILIASGLENADVYMLAGHAGKIIAEKKFTLSREQIIYEIPVKDKWRGGIYFTFHLIANNTVTSREFDVNIPRTNKQLKISLETFRNKITPGKKETWRLRIKDNSGDPAEAEVLASMYDASLDDLPGLRAHSHWGLYPFSETESMKGFWSTTFRSTNYINIISDRSVLLKVRPRFYLSKLNYFGFAPGDYHKEERSVKSKAFLGQQTESSGIFGYIPEIAQMQAGALNAGAIQFQECRVLAANGPARDSSGKDVKLDVPEKNNPVSLRRNLSETAFFYPHIVTDDNGEAVIEFTSPEALTKWKFQLLAHTRQMEYAYLLRGAVTQKELMVKPNPPRFLREGDTITFTARVFSLADKNIKGKTYLRLFDGSVSADSLLGNLSPEQNFSLHKGESRVFSWKINVPENRLDLLRYQVFAESDSTSDGEENIIPVLKKSIMVTETLPLSLKPHEERSFKMTGMQEHFHKVISNQRVTFEYTANPVWYALEALPYLMEKDNESSVSLFERLYANSVAMNIMNSDPAIRRVFESRKEIGESSFISNLEKNPELKNLLLQENPWLMEAGNEKEQTERLSLYFNTPYISSELSLAERKLAEQQNSNGSWSWFPGMRENPSLTAGIIAGAGRLQKMGINFNEQYRLSNSINSAIAYWDGLLYKHYENMKNGQKGAPAGISEYDALQYLYGRSILRKEDIKSPPSAIMDYWLNYFRDNWLKHRENIQAMIALLLHRNGDSLTSGNILRSLKENAVQDEDSSIYFKNLNGCSWYDSGIEAQTVIIEAFEEIMHDSMTVGKLKSWLIKQKRTSRWKSSRAAADAVYALLMTGVNWIKENHLPEITIAGRTLDLNGRGEEGGYIKESWVKEEIKPELSEIKIVNHNNCPSWGGLYWQYTDNMDRVTGAESDLKISKGLFIKRKVNNEDILVEAGEKNPLRTGDEVIVRMVIYSKADMEYVHLKDTRAPGFEPVNVISETKYREGLCYYETTRDASVSFFIEKLKKGTYVFEYPLRAVYKGNYSAGIATIQSMYAPEFSAHSGGTRITVE